MKRIQSLEMKNICKSFGPVLANNDINLTVESGEVLGLLGENGAGKSTLMNILFGLYQPSSGNIFINGKAETFKTPRDAIHKGIGMVHQHYMLVDNHTVEENIGLAMDEAPFWKPHQYIRRRLEEFSSRYGLTVDPGSKIWQLSAGEQQRVEIIKALLQGADLLILDEPTSVLTPGEVEELFVILRRMINEGHSAILISHKLDEIMNICSRVTVLRKGEISGEAGTASVNKKDLARMMVGREVLFQFEHRDIKPGETVLDVEGLSAQGDRGEIAVASVNFNVRESEVLGIAGVSGNGQKELVECVTGLRHAAGGTIRMRGKDITNQSARVMNAMGISHIPEERIKFGTVPNLLVYENAVLKHHTTKPFSDVVFLDYGNIKSHAETIVKDFQVATPSINTHTKNLSGGNIQKLIVGREMAPNPDLLVASHPTYGLDVGATEYIRNQLLAHRDRGGAVLLISEDLDEILELSDRVLVMFGGKVMGCLDRGKAGKEQIGMLMAGCVEEQDASCADND